MMRRAPWLPCLRSKPLSSTTSAKRTPHQIPPSPPCAPSPPFSPRTETGKSLNLEERARGVHTHTRTKEVCVSASFARAPPPRTPHERRARRAQAPGTRDRALLLAPGALPRERRPGAKKREGLAFACHHRATPPLLPLSRSLSLPSLALFRRCARSSRGPSWSCCGRVGTRLGAWWPRREGGLESGGPVCPCCSLARRTLSLFALHRTARARAHLLTASPLLTTSVPTSTPLQ